MVIGFILLLILVSSILLLFALKKQNHIETVGSVKELVMVDSEFNIPKFINGRFSEKTVHTSHEALEALNDLKEEFGFSDIYQEFVLDSKEVSESITYYRFNQVYQGIPVLNQNIIIRVDKDHHVIGFSSYYVPNVKVSMDKTISEEQLESIISSVFGSKNTIKRKEIAILARTSKSQLIYVLEGYSDTEALEVIIDAHTGNIISKINSLSYARPYSYTGEGIDGINYAITLQQECDSNDCTYTFYDPERNIVVADISRVGYITGVLTGPITPNIILSITNGKVDTHNIDEKTLKNAITTMAHYEQIYDYYWKVLGRKSYDNKGGKIIVKINVSEETFQDQDLDNAFWAPYINQMFVGNSNGKSYSASLDVLAHEFTHGVINHTAKFASFPKREDRNKAFETGALNEGYADILGSLIEGKNWTVAENNEVIRDLSNPLAYNNPIMKGGKYYFPDGYLSEDLSLEELLRRLKMESVSEYDKGGVHSNCNVVSYAAYLMYQNGVFANREEMAKVWYHSLLLLSSYSNFEDCALAVIESAKNLNLSDVAIAKITQAFIDTKMLEQDIYKVEGTITASKNKVQDALIEVFPFGKEEVIESAKSDSNGNYQMALPVGTYTVKVSKKGYIQSVYTIVVDGNVQLDISLSTSKQQQTASNSFCKSGNCHNLTIYFLNTDSNGKLGIDSETVKVQDGTIIDDAFITKTIFAFLKTDMIQKEGDSFYFTMGEMRMEFAWYYKDTDVKFDFEKPIVSDVSIEMKLNHGMFDNDFFVDIDSLFQS